MKTKYMLKSLLVTLIVILTFTNCSNEDELITELQVDREFAPVELSSIIRNQTIVELSWVTEETVDFYVVDVSTSADYSNIVETVNVTESQIPVQIQLAGETLYYIRVKAVSNRGLDDSTYATTTATTLTEQLFFPIEPGDILATEATLRWLANSEVTEIVVNPGNITHVITPQEKADGVAVITGLTGETDYTAMLMNNSVIRGVQLFTTGIDIGSGILVTPSDDLFQMVADASPGDVLVLDAGDYTSQIGTITLDKSLTIRGLYSFDKPLLKVSFSIVTGATDVSLVDLDLTGDLPTELTDVVRYTDVGNFNSLLISGCNIHQYNRSFVAGNVSSAILTTLTVDNCVVTDVLTSGGDFIDFRNSDVLNVTVSNSTFNNCAPGRDFFRIDAAGDSNGTGLTVNVLLDSCTLYDVSNTAGKRILYIRFSSNAITVRKTLFAETLAIYSNQSSTDPNTNFVGNNYYNAPGFYDPTATLYDITTGYTTLDPGFANAAAGNFTVSNQTLIDNAVGDPRWRQ